MREYRKHKALEVLASWHYAGHIFAMTAEDLNGKGEIAEELAWRDMQIETLRAENIRLREEIFQARANYLGGEAAEVAKLREQRDRLVDALEEAMYSNSTMVSNLKANAILAEIGETK